FATEVEEKIPLADAAAQDHLDGVHAAGVALRDTYHLLVVGEVKVQKFDGVQGGFVADGQAAALVAVKDRTFFPKLTLVHCTILLFSIYQDDGFSLHRYHMGVHTIDIPESLPV